MCTGTGRSILGTWEFPCALCLHCLEHSQMSLFSFYIYIHSVACICASFAFALVFFSCHCHIWTITSGSTINDNTNNKYIAFSTSCSPGNNGNTRTNTVKHPTAFLWAMAASNFLSRVFFSTLLVVAFILEAALGLEYHLFHRLLLHIIPFFLLPLYRPVSLFYHFCLNKHFLRFVPIHKKRKRNVALFGWNE